MLAINGYNQIKENFSWEKIAEVIQMFIHYK